MRTEGPLELHKNDLHLANFSLSDYCRCWHCCTSLHAAHMPNVNTVTKLLLDAKNHAKGSCNGSAHLQTRQIWRTAVLAVQHFLQ